MTLNMEINISIGDTINLNCPVAGYPPLSIEWRREKNTTVFSKTQMFHRPIVDEGSFTNYTCNATNRFGSKIFVLTVKNNKGIILIVLFFSIDFIFYFLKMVIRNVQF